MNVESLVLDSRSPDIAANPKNSKVESPSILWVNLMVGSEVSDLSRQFGDVFDVSFHRTDKLDKATSGERRDFICFEYDYPDCDSLRVLKNTHELYPDIPIIMFTLQHSEELAVWALRNRVWDYHYKPFSRKDFESLSRVVVRYCKNSKLVPNKTNNSSKNTTIDSSYPNDVRFKGAGRNQAVIDLATNYLEANYDHKVTEKDVADLCELSRFQFSRLFKKVTGVTFQTHFLALRIDKAKELLMNPSAKVVDVAYTVGFTDPSYFTRAFRRVTGASPSHFRRG